MKDKSFYIIATMDGSDVDINRELFTVIDFELVDYHGITYVETDYEHNGLCIVSGMSDGDAVAFKLTQNLLMFKLNDSIFTDARVPGTGRHVILVSVPSSVIAEINQYYTDTSADRTRRTVENMVKLANINSTLHPTHISEAGII